MNERRIWSGMSVPSIRPASPRWKKLGPRDFGRAEAFLRRLEPNCVSTCARFLTMERFGDCLWGLSDSQGLSRDSSQGFPRGSINALLLYSKQTLLPVFSGFNSPAQAGLSWSMLRFLRKGQFHAAQGLRKDLLILERIMADLGRETLDPIDYDLMALDYGPAITTLRAGPAGLRIRTPEYHELENILPLQAAYEREEVLPQGSSFNMAACRLNLEHIFKEQQILVAELGGRIVAKANTSALSFTRVQIGGVFVRPDCRGLGIARRLCAELAGILKRSGWDLSLFVKKWNYSAQRVYRSIGFKPIADYRISYY
jgi:ribosomal protein S18 acetylase RimI-like enzyme